MEFNKEMLSSLHVWQSYAATLKDLPHGLETACGEGQTELQKALVYSCACVLFLVDLSM